MSDKPHDLGELASWFIKDFDRLPRRPFELLPGQKVIDPERFLYRLKCDVELLTRRLQRVKEELKPDLAREIDNGQPHHGTKK